MFIDDEKMLFQLTVAEFRGMLQDFFSEASQNKQEPDADNETRRNAYSICELANCLGCGKTKVQQMKSNGDFDGCYVSYGRKSIYNVTAILEKLRSNSKNER